MGFLGMPMPPVRKPQGVWKFEDSLFGINAFVALSSVPALSLPKDLPGASRDLVLWAYELGYRAGEWDGEEEAKRVFRKAIGVD